MTCAILAGLLAWTILLGGNLALSLVPQKWFDEDPDCQARLEGLGMKPLTRNTNILVAQGEILIASTFLCLVGVACTSLAAAFRKRDGLMNLATSFNLVLAVPGLVLILALYRYL